MHSLALLLSISARHYISITLCTVYTVRVCVELELKIVEAEL